MASENSVRNNKKEYEHGGHRKRMRARLLDKGGANLTEVELLEMLLYYAIPMKDTRKQAEALLDKFGSLEAVLDADRKTLSEISGLKDGAEVLFSLLRETVIRYNGMRTEPSLMEEERLKKYLIELYKGVPVETVYAFYFASDGKLVGKQIIFRGGLSSVRFSLRTITEGVLSAGGHYVVLAHNHPSDRLVPSQDDILTTKRIASHLAANEVELMEHYIVGSDDCIGMFSVEKRKNPYECLSELGL